MVSSCWCAGSMSAEKVGQGEVGGVNRKVLCTWQLLGLAVKRSWLAPGGVTGMCMLQAVSSETNSKSEASHDALTR